MRSYLFLDCIFPCRVTGRWCWSLFQLAGKPLEESPAHLRTQFEHSVPDSRVPQQCSPATSTPSIYVCNQRLNQDTPHPQFPAQHPTDCFYSHSFTLTESFVFENLFKLSLDSISHQNDPLHFKSSACVDACVLITEL